MGPRVMVRLAKGPVVTQPWPVPRGMKKSGAPLPPMLMVALVMLAYSPLPPREVSEPSKSGDSLGSRCESRLYSQ